MDPLFSKALVLTDAHFGRSGNSPVANQDNLDFLAWAIDRAKSWGATIAIVMGDWHDQRLGIQTGTLYASLEGMDMLNRAFDKVYWILGNHDLLYRDRRDFASIEFGRNLDNFIIMREPTVIGECCFLPWLIKDEHKTVGNLRSRYTFSHLELAGFMMNAQVVAPETSHSVKPDSFKNQEFVFTGHFHKRQQQRNIIYTGSIMPFNFSDAGDAERGMMLLEWGKDPIFEAWPEQPLYRHLKLSALIDRPGELLRPKMTIKANLDIDLTFEEAEQVREALLQEYDLRKVELLRLSQPDATDTLDEDIEFKDVDQMITEGIRSIESQTIDIGLLAQEYDACRLQDNSR